MVAYIPSSDVDLYRPQDIASSEGEQTLVTPASPALLAVKEGKKAVVSPSRAWTGDTYLEGVAIGDQLSTSPSTSVGRSRRQSMSPFSSIPEDSEPLGHRDSRATLSEHWQVGQPWLENGTSNLTSHDGNGYHSAFTQSPTIRPTNGLNPGAEAASYASSNMSSTSKTGQIHEVTM